VAGQLWNKAGILDADFAPVIAITDRSRRTRPLSGQAGARQCRAPLRQLDDLTNLPPTDAHFLSDIAEKPWPLQAFRPLQAFAALLQALWPLQALAAKHCPFAAFALVDTVETAAPARNRVAAAAASVAPDLESNFMTISLMIGCRQKNVTS